MLKLAIFVLLAVAYGEQKTDTDPQHETCTTDSGIVGKCVPSYLCDGKKKRVVTDGRRLLDIRKRRSTEEPCSSYLDTCCALVNDLTVDMPTPPTPPASDEGCGWRNPDGVGFNTTKEVNNKAKFGEFPWMVALLQLELTNDGDKVNVYSGGGSLIHPNVVLTAAHYASGPSQLRVRVGEWDTQTKNELYPHQDRDVKEVVIHKDYNKENLFYDVALLFLDKPVDMSKPHIGLACLPSQGRRATAGTRCQTSGWGKNKFGSKGMYQVVLSRTEVPVVDCGVCQTQLRKTRLGAYFQLHSSFMCAGGEAGKDVCKGGGGSPLVCPIQNQKNRYVQNGIVSWGIGCGDDGIPGVYVDVANFRSWIDDKVAGHGYDPKTYTY